MATRTQRKSRLKKVRAHYAHARAHNLALRHERMTVTDDTPVGQRALQAAVLDKFNVQKHDFMDSVDAYLSSLTMKDLRKVAQDKGIRVDGKRPSLCTKPELTDALTDYYRGLA